MNNFRRHGCSLLLLALCLVQALPAGAESGSLQQALRALALPLSDSQDLDPLIEAVGDARWILLGESSHGTHEFYVWRDRVSRRLIAEKGFDFVAVEGNWSALLPLDRYVRLAPGAPASATAALLDLRDWPAWVWSNREFAAFAEWLREFNRSRPAAQRVGIHGIDLYGWWDSLHAVLAYADAEGAATGAAVRQAYAPLLSSDGKVSLYGSQLRSGGPSAATGVREVSEWLADRYRAAVAVGSGDAVFGIYQHARVVAGAESHLRSMFAGEPGGWNARVDHFQATLERLGQHYGEHSRAVVWAHNTHIGDARATEMWRVGERNIGQSLRERYGEESVFAVGFATALGEVIAGPRWEGEAEIMVVPEPRPDSIEAALLAALPDERLILLDRSSLQTAVLQMEMPHRAIGVVFVPGTEPLHNYVVSRVASRYEALIFLPRTIAVQALDARIDSRRRAQ